MSVGGNLPRSFLHNGESAAKESLCGSHVPGATEQRIDQIAVLVDRAIQVTLLPFYFQIGFVYVPAAADFSLRLAAQLFGEQRSKPLLPIPHCFMSELVPSQQKHLRQIP
jgi:hypothetical protein